MPQSPIPHRLMAPTIALLLVACVPQAPAPLRAAPPAPPTIADVVTPIPAPPAPTTTAAGVQVEGLLTRKGPDLDSWWAITTDDGQLWRLAAPDAMASALQAAQNTRVRAQGTRQGSNLAIPVLRLDRWQAAER